MPTFCTDINTECTTFEEGIFGDSKLTHTVRVMNVHLLHRSILFPVSFTEWVARGDEISSSLKILLSEAWW